MTDVCACGHDVTDHASGYPVGCIHCRNCTEFADRSTHVSRFAMGGPEMTDERLAEIASALVAIGKACLVVAPTLRKPYSDDPLQNPWDKFVQGPASRAYNLGHELRRELRARGVEVPR